MSPLRGILLKLAAVFVFVAMSALIKAARVEAPAGEALFFRAFFALPVILGWLLWRGQLHQGLRTANKQSHVFRGLFGTAAMGMSFAGLGLLPLPEVTAIGYAAPLLVVVFATMFLGEKVGRFRLSMVALGLAGVLIVLGPRLSVGVGEADARETLGALVVLFGAVFAALAQVFVRKMVATESTSAIVFWFSVTATCASFVTLPWGWIVPSGGVAAMLVGAGLLGGIGQILLTSSYRHADASLIAPFDYASILLALVIGHVVFGEAPTLTMLAGATLVVAAGVAIILRERHLGLERARQAKAMTNGQ